MPEALPSSRRSFLEASGFALFLAVTGGCQRDAAQEALVSPERSPGVARGKSRYYASLCPGCSAGCGVVIKSCDGRPIKLEGNPNHPLSRGGLCAVGQASILELYDSDRLQGPLIDGQPAEWETVDQEVTAKLEAIREDGGAVRVLTDSIISPTRRATIARFLEQFSDARHVMYDPLSSSAIPAAHEKTHGLAALPHYRLDRAEVIASFDADFLGTWISPVEFTAGYQSGRVPRGDPPKMSYHVQYESRMSLTGSNADRRVCRHPAEIPLVMSHLAVRLARLARRPLAHGKLPPVPVPAGEIDELAERLWQAGERGLVLCGLQDGKAQVLANYMNELLGAYGNTLDVARPSYQRQGRDERLGELIEELNEGRVAALLIAGVNPVCDLPQGAALAESLSQVPLVVSFSEHEDETAEHATYVCPAGHPLESWHDAEAVAGVVTISQPAIRRLGNTRPLVETLATWLGQPESDQTLVRKHWREVIHTRHGGEKPFSEFWDQTLRDGYTEVEPDSPAPQAFDHDVVRLFEDSPHPIAEQPTLVLYAKPSMLDGRHAHNPWLQELPDPISKVTWDNYACLSPATAARLQVRAGDVIRISAERGEGETATVELPVVVQPGQHDGVVAVALGYGRQASARFAHLGPQWIEARSTLGGNGLVGVNAAPFLQIRDGLLRYERSPVHLQVTGDHHPLAATQRYHRLDVPAHLATPGAEHRPMVEETTLDQYRGDPRAGSHSHAVPEGDLWPDDHPMHGAHWGMAIDLNKCTGCSACVIACQAENNVPVVGRDEVRRNREMHWIRIDRYFVEHGDSVAAVFQPMLCQHCNNAPCETVCPVLATVHSEEGLNQQVYNRCVGTRYCANNCPYKVRRFNWFAYAHDDKLQNAVLNPNVTVRSRGVMEKCSFCVQRIQEAKIEARGQSRAVSDGEIQPACQQSCPAGAIVFGDLNDPESRVAALADAPRAYRLLVELNVRPSVAYLRMVRNRRQSEEHHG